MSEQTVIAILQAAVAASAFLFIGLVIVTRPKIDPEDYERPPGDW